MLQANSESAPYSGALTVATVPAGDPADVTARLGPALAAAGLIATADTQRLHTLAASLGIAMAGRVVSCADGDPPGCVPALLAELRAGQDVLLVTGDGAADTGDAGRRLVAAASAAGVRLTVLPGPSAITAALAVSGLPADRFTFEGSLPERADIRERRFAELAAERRTLIFTETPRRAARTLAELAGALGAGRPAVVCRALATADRDVQRGTLGELAGRLSGHNSGGTTPRSPASGGEGDLTIVVAGAPVPDAAAAAASEPDALADAVARVRARVADGATTRDAVAAVAAQTGLRKRDLYNAAAGSRPALPPRSDR